MKRPKPRREIFECPNCGADVPVGSKVCRECGSDDSTGWQSSEEIDYQSLELPETDGGDADASAPADRRRLLWTVLATLLIVALAVLAMLLGRVI